MSSVKKDGPEKAAGSDADKRVHATLDLKATEVKPADAKPAAAAQGASQPTGTASASAPTSNAAAAQKIAEADKSRASQPQSARPASPAASAAKPAEPAARAAAETPPVSPPSRSGGGFISHAAAAVVGGLLVLFGGDHLKPLVGLGGQTSQSSDELRQRLGKLEAAAAQRPAPGPSPELAQKLAAAEQRVAKLEDIPKTLGALTDAQAKLEAEARALAERISKAGSANDAAERVAKLEETLSTMAKAAEANPAQAGRLPQLAAITGKLADLENAVTSRSTALRKEVMQEVETRLGTVTEASEAAKAGSQRLDREIATVKGDAAKLGQRVEVLKSASDKLEQTIRVVQEEAAGLKTGLDGLKGDVESKFKSTAKPGDISQAVSPIANKVAALEQSVQGVVKSEDDRKANAERIVLALELANLKRALDRGATFKAELSEVRRVAGGKLDLKALETYQDKGLPTLSDLTRDFRPLVNSMIDAETEPADAGVVDRLMSGAKSIVRVRKTGHAADDRSIEAAVGRIEAALKDARLGDVVDEGRKLPAKAKEIAAAWLAKVEARQSVDKALSGIEASLKSSLGAATDKGAKQ